MPRQWWRYAGRCGLAAPARFRQRFARTRTPPGRARGLRRRRRLCGVGRTSSAHRSRNGNLPRVVDWLDNFTSGAASSRQSTSITPTFIKGPFPHAMRDSTASPVSRRSPVFAPMGTGSSTWQATSGSGSATGIGLTTTRRSPRLVVSSRTHADQMIRSIQPNQVQPNAGSAAGHFCVRLGSCSRYLVGTRGKG